MVSLECELRAQEEVQFGRILHIPMSFSIGDKVIYVTSKERGIIIKVHPPMRGRQMYDVVINGNVGQFSAGNLIADFELTDPFERVMKGLYGVRSDFSQINTSHKIENTSNSSISTLKASNTLFKAYQFKPLLKFLNSDNRRILIADEVGLGKTIEAGHIMLELRARHELQRNSLIVCPNSLQRKWHEELKKKFNLHYKIYENKQELINDLQHRNGSVMGIINYEKVQKKREEGVNKSLLKILEDRLIEFDFVLFDEAHRLRNSNTQLYKGVEQLVAVAKSVVMLTATPIMINEDNLFNLLHLLDPLAYDNKLTFRNQLNVNKPLISALSKLNSNYPFKSIAKELSSEIIELVYTLGEDGEAYFSTMTVDEAFQGVELYERVIQDLNNLEDSHENRVHIQFNLTNMSELNSIFSRTRKREVTTDMNQARREPHVVSIRLYDDEREKFDEILDRYFQENSYLDPYGNQRLPQGKVLGLVQKKRRLASSVFGYLSEDDELERGFNRFVNFPDAKLEKLLEVIQKVCLDGGRKLIVFAIFRKTLEYLRVRLKVKGVTTAVIHGKIDDRDVVIEKFKGNNEVQVLLSSEVGAEGLDFQFCDAIVNYDLPWNPMVVEQRIGRIDRFGQTSSVLNIYNFVVEDSIQEVIYDRLLSRIGIFERSIGDLEAILSKEIEIDGSVRSIRNFLSNLDSIEYKQELTKEQRDEQIELIQKAIVTEREHLKEISEGLTDTMTNDVYFRNEIEQIKRAYKYVTEEELLIYLQELLRIHLTTSNLSELDGVNMCYELRWPLSEPKLLKRFLEQYMPVDEDHVFNFNQFIRILDGKNTFKFTLSQEYGYSNPEWVRVTAYHPLVVAALNFFKQSCDASSTTFALKIKSGYVAKYPALKSGSYFLATSSLLTQRSKYGVTNEFNQLIPVLYRLEDCKVIADLEVTEAFLGECQLHGEDLFDAGHIDPAVIPDLRFSLNDTITSIEKEILESERVRLNTHMDQKRKRVIELFGIRIQRQEALVEQTRHRAEFDGLQEEREKAKRILPLQESNLEKLERERDEALSRIQSASISSEFPKMLSLNRVDVY